MSHNALSHNALSHHAQTAAAERGFTLVEIALVVLIVGILIAGILIAQTIMRNARLAATYSAAGIYAAATREFIDKYDALPGDMIDATVRLAGCAGGCINGGGDNVIGTASQAIFTAAGPADETTQFWYHLQAADMIREIQIGAAPGAADPWGQSLPAASGSGGFQVRSTGGQFQDDGAALMGLYLRWQLVPFAAANASLVALPADAAYIDRKFDDGAPLHGKVRARGIDAGNAADACKLDANAYNEAATQIGCYMYFQLRETPGL